MTTQPAERPKPITSRGFAQVLIDAGIIDANYRRIVIDVQPDQPVMLYCERFGDERLLAVATTLQGIEVHTGIPVQTGTRYWVLVADDFWKHEPQWPAGFRHIQAGSPGQNAGTTWHQFEDDGAPPELDGKRVEVTFSSQEDGPPLISERQVQP